MQRIVLASGSPRRKELLGWLGLDFEVRVSEYDESTLYCHDVREYVQELALQKARLVANNLEDGVVIGADTVVELDGEVIGKPKDKKDAMRVISKLLGDSIGKISGKTHRVLTGVAVIKVESKEVHLGYEETRVTFRALSNDEKEKYVEGKFWEGFAGGYAIQQEAGKFVKKVEGSFTNIIGFPLHLVVELLGKAGVKTDVNVEQVIEKNTGYRS